MDEIILYEVGFRAFFYPQLFDLKQQCIAKFDCILFAMVLFLALEVFSGWSPLLYLFGDNSYFCMLFYHKAKLKALINAPPIRRPRFE